MTTPTSESKIVLVDEPRPRSAVATQPQGAVAIGTPADLLRVALAQGADLATLERFMKMQFELEARDAKKAFVVAMSAFKAEPLVIFKTKQVEFLDVKYKHAELADVTDVVVPALSRHGLAHRWNVKQEGERILVECIVTHALGHSESVSIEGKADTSGKKNAIQAIASAIQYLQRYTLLAVTGMATKSLHPDDDGRSAGAPFDASVMSAEDQAELTLLQAAALEGHGKLKPAYQVSTISETGWNLAKDSLIAAADLADKEAKNARPSTPAAKKAARR